MVEKLAKILLSRAPGGAWSCWDH